ncbi:PstS family phosphate ABC transporter substrate-binding protein [Nocardia sp. NPDC059177]|uniref:PstS family phosphate ABC transporter substrate-binding protein n=1 Tax=Nocardia sp. NPDC059177 TaxID=3346759 RepID=UPI0036844A1B
MGDFPIDVVLSLIGLLVAVAAFLREFVFVGRKRLGYRVQMNTPASRILEDPNAAPTPANSEAPQQKSLVLIRIENDGNAAIEDSDYGDAGRPRLSFRHHRVGIVEVTERVDQSGASIRPLSPALHAIAAGTDSDGLAEIVLPAERLERGEHYKVLAVLEGPAPDPLDRNASRVIQKVGSLKGGRFVLTSSGSRREPVLLGLSVFLAVVVLTQLLVAVLRPDPPPRDCADGTLTIVGSTALAPAVRKAAENYEKTCTAARFEFDFAGTEPGLRTLTLAGETPDMVAIGDGSKGDSFASLTEHPLVLSSFSMVVHPGVGLTDLTTQQIRDLYRGNIRNWNEIGGPDLPVVLIDRTAGSGTRRALEAKLLEDNRKVFRYASCVGMAPGGAQCEVDVTEEVATFVAKIPGAVGYLETSSVSAEVRAVSIDGVAPSQETVRAGSYPFTGVEYAYTHGPIAGDSLAAQFLDYLTRGKARLTMIEFGNIPCADESEQKFCTP